MEEPLYLKATIAYDVSRGDPFKRYMPLDFDCSKMSSSMQSIGAEIYSLGPNSISIKVSEPGFRIQVDGFDANRDVVVRIGEVNETND